MKRDIGSSIGHRNIIRNMGMHMDIDSTYYRYWMHMAHRHANPAYAEIVRNLKTQLKDLREELGEIDDQFPEIQKIIDENW